MRVPFMFLGLHSNGLICKGKSARYLYTIERPRWRGSNHVPPHAPFEHPAVRPRGATDARKAAKSVRGATGVHSDVDATRRDAR